MMNKTDFCRAVAVRTGKSLRETTAFVQVMQNVVMETLPREDVRVFDGVTLCTKIRPAAQRRNPMTGELIQVPAKRVPKCKFGAAVKNVVEAVPIEE